MKFDLSEWDRRRAGLLPVLEGAAAEGLVAPQAVAGLADYLLGRGVRTGDSVPPEAEGGFGLEAPRDEAFTPLEESESPRFVRGFHDILITIGVIVALVGVTGLLSIYATLPVILVLAEILVRRQRLALPAVVLTVAFGLCTAWALMPLLQVVLEIERWSLPITAATVSIVAALFYWRYRTPLSLAGALVSVYAGFVLTLALLMIKFTNMEALFDQHPQMLTMLLSLFALLVFGTALHFDLGDRLRRTRRSDVAFWLHLAAAPAILYAALSLVFSGAGGEWYSMTLEISQAAKIIAVVFGLMLLGIVLDRRAFVTSGLISLGYAIGVLITQGGADALSIPEGSIFFLVLIGIGIVVLSLGIGWSWLRAHVLAVLPQAVRDSLPPARQASAV